MEKMKLRLLLAVAAFASGCQSGHMYEGPRRPSTELAEVHAQLSNDAGIVVTHVDGRKATVTFGGNLYLPPGEHEFALSTGLYEPASRIGKERFRGYFKIRFPVRSAKLYTFRSNMSGSYSLYDKAEICAYEKPIDSGKGEGPLINSRYSSLGFPEVACAPIEIRQEK